MDLMAGPDAGWNKLHCDSCGSIHFLKRVHLITRQGGGTTEEVAGYVCRQCNADVDQARMIQRLEVERKRRELKDLQEQLGPDAEPEPAPASERPRKG
jgi:hypothetical protein